MNKKKPTQLFKIAGKMNDLQTVLNNIEKVWNSDHQRIVILRVIKYLLI